MSFPRGRHFQVAPMKPVNTLLLVSLILLSSVAYPQHRSASSANIRLKGAALAFGGVQIKEENIHPKTHSGLMMNLAYKKLNIGSRFSTYTFGIGASFLNTNLEDPFSSAHLELLSEYSYSFAVYDNRRFRYFLGPEGRLQYAVSVYPNWDDSHLYWANYVSLGVCNYLQYLATKENVLLFRLSVPFFSVSSRPTLNRKEKMDDFTFGGIIKSLHGNLQAGSVSSVFYLKCDLDYFFSFSDKIKQSVGYTFHYERLDHKEGNPVRTLYHAIGLRLYF